MQTRPVHPLFGVEVEGVDLRDASPDHLYPEIRDLFERHSLVLFREQHLDDDEHTAFSKLFGPLEDRSNVNMDGPPKISAVTNVSEDGSTYGTEDLKLMNLQSNMLWHTDSTFLPVPALANILQARVVPSSGGATEFVSSKAGFQSFAPELKEKLRHLFFHHRYGHSRAKINKELAEQMLFTMWKDQTWRAVWTNPVTGEESLYIASHVYAVEGMEEEEGTAFIDELTDAVTRPEHVYAHNWAPGDVIVWDERAVLHRGTPWPYDEPRTLVSYCVSARDIDGLASVSPHAA